MRGQWVGYFSYGPEYGEELVGEQVQFRLFIDRCDNGVFEGKSIDLEGVGANFELAEVKGFVDGDFISFTKQYPNLYSIDESGNTVVDQSRSHPIVSYTGAYDSRSKTYSGEWELRMEIQPIGEYWLEDICTGKWEIRKDD